jgi:A/G-specific adenine glycosylase
MVGSKSRQFDDVGRRSIRGVHAAPYTPAMPDFDPHRSLLDWYDEYQRTLPWRTNPDPYAVLVSEFMLQQTQVDRVIPYFERFLARFPTLEALALGPRADVIRLWSGLGYNRRAVHLHQAAQLVVERHGGRLPAERAALEALPGIGPYTAGAVLSIAFGHSEAAPDTNVQRVIGRYALGMSSTPRAVTDAARELVPDVRAGEWNQALMDLGSTICTNRKPRCLLCPLRAGCKSAGQVLPTSAKPRRPGPEYAGSTRYYRGRFLAALAGLAPGTVASIDTIANRLAVNGVAEPRAGWRTVGEALAREGLAQIEREVDGIRVGLA